MSALKNRLCQLITSWSHVTVTEFISVFFVSVLWTVKTFFFHISSLNSLLFGSVLYIFSSPSWQWSFYGSLPFSYLFHILLVHRIICTYLSVRTRLCIFFSTFCMCIINTLIVFICVICACLSFRLFSLSISVNILMLISDLGEWGLD